MACGRSENPNDAVARTNPNHPERIQRDALSRQAAEESLVLLKNQITNPKLPNQNSPLPGQIKQGETIAVLDQPWTLYPRYWVTTVVSRLFR
jgi:beta-glucosidase-like glycosyl hydrolase